MRPVTLLALLGATAAGAQPRPPSISAAAPARWIADTASPPGEYGVWLFRRTLDLPAPPARFVVHVSADNRYRLLVNGEPVASGPQRDDAMHWRYETVDLAPRLRAGRNVVAATVWNWGAHRPVGQQSRRTAFLLQGDTDAESVASTGTAGWRVARDTAWAPVPVRWPDNGGYYASPPGEAFDAARHPWGWESAAFDDARWRPAGPLEPAQPRGTDAYGLVSTWQLVPRTLPPMQDSLVRFARVRRATGVRPTDGWLRGAAPLTVPARTRATLLLDQGTLTNAHLLLDVGGGAGSTVAVTYAEGLVDTAMRKGHRESVEGRTMIGVRDRLHPDGGARRTLRSLWFRTYRYVQLDVETADASLVLHDVRGAFTGYPYEERGRFASDAGWIDSVWAMNWRTARLCAWETYFDTPYYEQLQYVGDTRLQALLAYHVAGDDRLARNAILQFDRSRAADGLTASRWPSDLPQFIPPFSLLWVAMVHDFWMLRDDPAFVRDRLPGTRGVLAWFEARVDSMGMVGAAPWWGFVDWAPQWDRGVPPGGERGGSTAVTLQYAYALDRAAQLEDSLGLPALAAQYRTRAAGLREAVRRRAWDAGRGLFRDAPDSAAFSQQANVLAVLAGAVPASERAAVMRRVLDDTTLVRASHYFGWYLLEALRESGLGDRYVEQLAPWRAMLAMGFTTTPEAPEPARSDSHAWSAHPNVGLLSTVLGVRPGSPGFRTVLVEPHLGTLARAEGRVPHPRGEVVVRLVRVGARGLRAEVTLPPGTTGTFVHEGRRVPLRAGRQEVTP